ncbi:hypothetical protein L484_016167 [Morus notabilis]|uniref:Uncharacterized protein n=1 Tax=Morus notabilis TaxID=981085 RepID=W9QBR3_9ROSA|nr:hypothetical protein L484_016167 [Morus notabilis]
MVAGHSPAQAQLQSALPDEDPLDSDRDCPLYRPDLGQSRPDLQDSRSEPHTTLHHDPHQPPSVLVAFPPMLIFVLDFPDLVAT